VRKYLYDGLASLTSAVDYPERKRKLAKFDEGIVTTAPHEDREFEAFDSFGNPTNPELKLGYLQRQVGKRLYPWHDWGTHWRLLGKASRFEVKGGVSDQVQDLRQPDERPWLLVGSDEVTAFLNDWLWHVFEGHDRYFRRRDSATLPVEIRWWGAETFLAVRKRVRCYAQYGKWSCLWWRPVDDTVRIRTPDGVTEVATEWGNALLPFPLRQGSFDSYQHYAKPKPVDPEAARLIRYVCEQQLRWPLDIPLNPNGIMRWPTDRVYRHIIHIPHRRQLDAYRHWDKHGNRVDKVTRLQWQEGEDLQLSYFAHTADAIPPNSWHLKRHWRTTYPIGSDHRHRRDDGWTFTPRHHDYFMLLYGKFGVKAKEFGRKFEPGKGFFRKPHYSAKGKHHHETDRTPEIISEPLRRKAA
jgi:hypothetical protein